MPNTTNRVKLPYILQSQSQKEVMHNASLDLIDAFHPQTILAWAMNDRMLSVAHGAPIRLRVERQLGYKHAKSVMRIDAVASLAGIGLGKGGYWEDRVDYDWYAGI
jgi:DMSO/TMAO reductase YedYZ molybdopterin-dependent catalytic subunit